MVILIIKMYNVNKVGNNVIISYLCAMPLTFSFRFLFYNKFLLCLIIKKRFLVKYINTKYINKIILYHYFVLQNFNLN